MLDFALYNKKEFLRDLFNKAMEVRRKKQEELRDDGREELEIFTEARNYFAEKYTPQRQCPKCGTGVEITSLLPSGAQRSLN